MSDIPDVETGEKPFSRLTALTQTMTDALEKALKVEAEISPEPPSPVRTIVFLEDEEKAGIQMFGYDSEVEAMAALFVHMKAIFQASGRDLEFVGIPDNAEGAEG